jgi:hypothetical protein
MLQDKSYGHLSVENDTSERIEPEVHSRLRRILNRLRRSTD